jgi:hypothetical protein
VIRLAQPVFFSAMALLFGGIVLSAEEEKAATFDTLLETEGVRVVEIRAKDALEVTFCAKGKPRVTADNDGGTTIAANRSGDRLVVIARVKHYDNLEVCLPAGIRELHVARASVETAKGVTVDDLRIVASQGLSWDGRAGKLRLELPARPPTCKEACDNNVRVEGAIDSLAVVVEAGEADVARPETMGDVTVALGPASTIGLGDTREPGRVRMTDLAGRPLPAGGGRVPVQDDEDEDGD